MAGSDDDDRASETERLVAELAEVRKRMKARAEQPIRANGSGAYRAVTMPLPLSPSRMPVAKRVPEVEVSTADAREADRSTDRPTERTSDRAPDRTSEKPTVERPTERPADERTTPPPPASRRRPG